jgi:hypothetical protein
MVFTERIKFSLLTLHSCSVKVGKVDVDSKDDSAIRPKHHNTLKKTNLAILSSIEHKPFPRKYEICEGEDSV